MPPPAPPPLTGRPPCAEPTGAPAGLNATALSASEIQVSWTAVRQPSPEGILRGYEVWSAAGAPPPQLMGGRGCGGV